MRALAPLLLLLSFETSADIYKWLDEHGVLHYSNKAHEGAEQLPLLTQDMIGRPVPSVGVPKKADDAVRKAAHQEQLKLQKKLRQTHLKRGASR